MGSVLQVVVATGEGGVGWFPQAHAEVFYIVKGVAALVAVVLLLTHMDRAWNEDLTLGRRLRYLSLLAFGVTIAGASVEQVSDKVLVSYRNIGGAVCVALLIVAMVVSIRETRKRP